MQVRSFDSGIRVAIIVLALGCGRAFGGFTDEAYAGDVTPPIASDPFVDGEEILEFSITGDRSNECVPPVQTLSQRPVPPAAAPLPIALLPGGIMLAGSFIVTRIFKRRIV